MSEKVETKKMTCPTTEELKKKWDGYGNKYASGIEPITRDIQFEELQQRKFFDGKRKILELGCGSGRFLEKLLQFHKFDRVDAWDLSDTMIEAAKERV